MRFGFFSSKGVGGSAALAFLAVVFAAACLPTLGQSSDLRFPTPITTNEVVGRITPRPLGDSRETLYYWVFDGSQGDVFINATFENLNGEIEVFVADGMRPVARILTFADFGETETGRVFYLRRPERLILRVKGRTPNDDPAAFRIKFAGSFVAIADPEKFAVPELPVVQRPAAREEPAEVEREEEKEIAAAPATEKEAIVEREPAPRPITPRQERRSRARVVVEDPTEKLPAPEKDRKETDVPREDVTREEERESELPERAFETPAAESKAEAKPVRERALVVRFTDGSSLDVPMSDVRSFSVDGSVLRITTRNGRTRRFPMSEVTSLTVD